MARRVPAPRLLGWALLGWLLSSQIAAAASPTQLDGDACRTVRLSDVGWTDVTSTTAMFSVLLGQLGYRPQVTVLSVPVTFASMKNKDIDVFLGNWMPTQEGDRKAYVADGSVGSDRPQPDRRQVHAGGARLYL